MRGRDCDSPAEMVSTTSVELLLHHLVSRHMAVRVGQTISVCPERTPQTARCDAEHMSVQGNTSSYCSAHHIMINSLYSLAVCGTREGLSEGRILFVKL